MFSICKVGCRCKVTSLHEVEFILLYFILFYIFLRVLFTVHQSDNPRQESVFMSGGLGVMLRGGGKSL